MINQPISFRKPHKQSEEWKDDGLIYFSNQTSYLSLYYSLSLSLSFPDEGMFLSVLRYWMKACFSPLRNKGMFAWAIVFGFLAQKLASDFWLLPFAIAFLIDF